jgi:hypothetical protein
VRRWLTDSALIGAEYLGRRPGPLPDGMRRYRALYRDGRELIFACGHSEAAAKYAREYGRRILDPASAVVYVRWVREDS